MYSKRFYGLIHNIVVYFQVFINFAKIQTDLYDEEFDSENKGKGIFSDIVISY